MGKRLRLRYESELLARAAGRNRVSLNYVSALTLLSLSLTIAYVILRGLVWLRVGGAHVDDNLVVLVADQHLAVLQVHVHFDLSRGPPSVFFVG